MKREDGERKGKIRKRQRKRNKRPEGRTPSCLAVEYTKTRCVAVARCCITEYRILIRRPTNCTENVMSRTMKKSALAARLVEPGTSEEEIKQNRKGKRRKRVGPSDKKLTFPPTSSYRSLPRAQPALGEGATLTLVARKESRCGLSEPNVMSQRGGES